MVESAGRPNKYLDNPLEDRTEDQGSTSDILYGEYKGAKWIKKGKKAIMAIKYLQVLMIIMGLYK
ncbi:hypothetical protein [Francisella sp. Scap27]|uniref:hypothetical protein n=1 Tax=Francisella sp. Scap27 TaxID=2589986 RepID=UPI002118B48A|nr:hypothetical protein [Francisella sp. Scap27]